MFRPAVFLWKALDVARTLPGISYLNVISRYLTRVLLRANNACSNSTEKNQQRARHFRSAAAARIKGKRAPSYVALEVLLTPLPDFRMA